MVHTSPPAIPWRIPTTSPRPALRKTLSALLEQALDFASQLFAFLVAPHILHTQVVVAARDSGTPLSRRVFARRFSIETLAALNRIVSSQTYDDSQLVDLANATCAIGEVIIKVSLKTGYLKSTIAKDRGHFGHLLIGDRHDRHRRNVRPIGNRSIR